MNFLLKINNIFKDINIEPFSTNIDSERSILFLDDKKHFKTRKNREVQLIWLVILY